VSIETLLILATTKMLGGVCFAAMSTVPDPTTGLCWARPVREHGHVLLGDITTDTGHVLEPFDVAELSLVRARGDPPHVEDWIADFVHHRPRLVRRLEGERRAAFLRSHLDGAPSEVFDCQQRSLCLVRPDWIKGCFRLDSHSGQLDARLAFTLGGRRYQGSVAKGGHSVTDLRWRALGRSWLPEAGGWTEFEADELRRRCGIEEIYLALGLSRSFEGSFWPLVIGVHTVPDYRAVVDYRNL
jgi:hypothetical protein